MSLVATLSFIFQIQSSPSLLPSESTYSGRPNNTHFDYSDDLSLPVLDFVMRIEQRLNEVGRGRLLSSSQTPRKEWVDALNELNSGNVDETPEFIVSCLYSLLRLNPATCMS